MNREQKAIIDEASSDQHTISSGVPQGTILGPFFFVIFIIDLPDAVSSWNMVALYADDCQTSRVIQRQYNHESFQEDLDDLASFISLATV